MGNGYCSCKERFFLGNGRVFLAMYNMYMPQQVESQEELNADSNPFKKEKEEENIQFFLSRLRPLHLVVVPCYPDLQIILRLPLDGMMTTV